MARAARPSKTRKVRAARIRHLPDNLDVEVAPGQTILEASLAAGIPHTHACGGHARCSTCRVMVLEGLQRCSPRTAAEKKLARHLGFDCSVRLACQTRVTGDVSVRRLVRDCEDEELAKDAAHDVSRGSAGEERNLAILFADIAGFTAFAEALPPYDVIHTLNRYYHLVGDVVRRHGGTINSYAGDGFMALFGLDKPEDAAADAVRAGLGVIGAMDKLNSYIGPLYGREFAVRVGVHWGEVVVGALGARDNQHLTVIGDAVNFASRLEAANKQTGTAFLVSREVAGKVGSSFKLRPLPAQEIAGKSGSHELFEVLG